MIFLLSGFWHGANWTFVLWGAYHALLFLPLILTGKNRKYMDAPTWRDLPKILLTFALVVFGWIIFRAESISQFAEYVQGMCKASLFTIPWLMNRWYYIPLAISIGFMLVVEWINRAEMHEFAINKTIPLRWIRRIIHFGTILSLIYFGNISYNTFIYFQF